MKTRMMHLGLFVLATAVALPAAAQEPHAANHKNFKLQFENDYVKVVRVHFDPHEAVTEHEHSHLAGVYVYLNDNGPVIYRHVAGFNGLRNRQFQPAGSFHVSIRFPETHTVENPTDKPVDYLRIEYKTDGESATFGGDVRAYREGYAVGRNARKVQYENEQVRITRLNAAPGNKLAITATATEPALIVATTPGKRTGGKPPLALGDTAFLAANETLELENTATGVLDIVEVLRIDLKTKPMTKAQLDASTADYQQRLEKTKADIAAAKK